MTGLRLGPEIQLDTGYKFTRAVDCNLLELESVLDYFAPASERQGNWIHNPQPQDPEEIYRACYETIRHLDQNTELTAAQYIRRALADKEEGSSAIFQFVITLAEYLQKNISEESK